MKQINDDKTDQKSEMEMLCMMVTFRLEAGIHAHTKVTTTGVNLT